MSNKAETAKTYESQPGVYVYDTFVYPQNEKMFMTVVIAEIDPIQYWRDRPLLINSPLPITAKAVNMTSNELASLTQNATVIDSIQETENLEPVIIEQTGEALEIIDEMLALDYSPGSGSGSGSVLEESNLDIMQTDFILSRIGIRPDELKTDSSRPEEWLDLVEEYADTYDPVSIQIADIYKQIEPQYFPSNQSKRVEIADDGWRPLGEPHDQWYGIPLINLGPQDTPTSESYIVGMSQKNDWNVGLLNTVTTGLKNSFLVINKQIPPSKKFLVGFYMVENRYGLILKIEGDPKVYQKEISTFNDREKTPIALSYGVDNDFLKSLYGHIWDILFWHQPSNFNHNLPSVEPNYPLDGWVYDFRKTGVYSSSVGGTIDGNTVRSIYDYGPSARVGSGPNNSDGRFVHLIPDLGNTATGFYGIHPWYFIYDTYMDNFFCRSKLKQGSFTIQWFQWLPWYPTGINNWLSDSVYSNYLSYDYTNFRLILEFNGHRYQETITLPCKLWAQFAIRYNQLTGDLIFTFRDLKFKIQEKVQINIGLDLELELISLFGRFDKEEKQYVESHKGLMGMVMIHEEFRNDADLERTADDVSQYLNQYKPAPGQIFRQTETEET